MDNEKALREQIHEEINDEAKDIANQYAKEISRAAQVENIQNLINRKELIKLLEYVYFSPINQRSETVDEYMGYERGTVNILLQNDESPCCRLFACCYNQMRTKKDFRINRTLAMEAMTDPKFGLEYQKLTQPQEFGKQVIEKTEHKTLTMEIKNLPDQELDNRIKQLENKLTIKSPTLEMKKNDSGEYEHIDNDS